MTNQILKPQTRPTLISIVCLLGFLYTLFGVALILIAPQSVAELVRLYGRHLPILSVIINIISLAGFIGIWRMRYWGLLVYTLCYIAGGILAQVTGFEILWAYVPGFIVILSGLIYINRFD